MQVCKLAPEAANYPEWFKELRAQIMELLTADQAGADTPAEPTDPKVKPVTPISAA
jgi:hypothetical protein